MSLNYDEDLRGIHKELRRLSKKICCDDCLEIEGTCEDGQIPVWNEAEEIWECGEAASEGVTSIAAEGEALLTGDVTISAGDGVTLTQVGQDIEVAATPVTLNADTPTQNALNLSGQEVQVNVATQTEYGVVKLEDLYANFVQVANYAALPDPTLHAGEYYHVLASQGTSWLPGSLGGTYYQKGIYTSDGVSWSFTSESPYNATQPTVDAGANNDQFVTPATLNSAATVSHPGHTHAITDITSFTKSQLNTAVSDGDPLYVGDVTTNATHTGEVTGATTLTVDKTAITNKTLVTAVSTDHILIADASDSDNLKKALLSDVMASSSTFDYSQVLFAQVFS